jgi:general secretion pathway protein L
MTTLIVTLPLSMPETGTEYDFVLTPDGRIVTRLGRAAASLLPSVSKAGDEVVAVVPARALSWHRVDLPKGVIDNRLISRGGQPARLRAVLEGLLEEQLLDDPATVHFALAPDARAAQPVWVACATVAGCAQPCRRLKQHDTRCRASCRSSRPKPLQAVRRRPCLSRRGWIPRKSLFPVPTVLPCCRSLP